MLNATEASLLMFLCFIQPDANEGGNYQCISMKDYDKKPMKTFTLNCVGPFKDRKGDEYSVCRTVRKNGMMGPLLQCETQSETPVQESFMLACRR